MSKLWDLIEQVKLWPQERQRDVEHVLEAMIEGGTETYVLSQEERELVEEGLGSRIVSAGEVQTFRQRHAA